jgi:hypothetical protein
LSIFAKFFKICGMDEVQIRELWEQNYPNRFADPMARQVCRLICHLIHTIAQNDASSSTPLQKFRTALASINIPESQYDEVIHGN